MNSSHNRESCCVTSVLSNTSEKSIVGSKLDTEFDPYESIQEWLNRELGGKFSPDSEKIDPDSDFRSNSPILDDWDDISYDSDDDEEFDFSRILQSPKSFDCGSVPGSEGYGTDTSDLNDSLICWLNSQSNSLQTPTTSSPSLQLPVKSEGTLELSKTKSEETNKIISFTSSQTICTGKSQTEIIRPRTLCTNENLIQGNAPKGAKITRVYQIPTIGTSSSVASKVGTQSRKTVVVKVLKPKNG